MLVVDRTTGKWEDRAFRDFPTFLTPSDCLVLNDSRVLPSRLYGHREHATGKVEIFLTKPVSADGLTWEALVHPGRKMRTGERIIHFRRSHCRDPRPRGIRRAHRASPSRLGTFSQFSRKSATSPCPPIFAVTTRLPTANVTRPSSPASLDRPPPPPLGSISPPKFSKPARLRRRHRSRHSARRARHFSASSH